MTTEPNQSTAPATFKRTEPQRFPPPITAWEIVQTLTEIPEDVASARHSHPGGPEVGVHRPRRRYYGVQRQADPHAS
jgi:hypothetical protein